MFAQLRFAGHITTDKARDLSSAAETPQFQSLSKNLSHLVRVINSPGWRTVFQDVRVSMGDHYDVAAVQSYALPIVEPDYSTSISEQVVNNHVLRTGRKMPGQGLCRGGANTPGNRKFSVVKEGPLQLHHLQYFRKYIHTSPPLRLAAKLSGLLGKRMTLQLRSEQKSRTRGQAPAKPSVHSFKSG